ncbi:10441_t:CDS:2, partial [Dentiscutata heterogama]
ICCTWYRNIKSTQAINFIHSRDFSIDMPRASNNNQHELDNNRHKKILAALNEHKNDSNKS